jgi:mRNA interferase RelE/StbE
MSFKIELTKSAAKEYKKLPKTIQEKVKELMILLSQNPRTEFLQIKKLKGPDDLFRIRVNDYRIVYEVYDQKLIILIIKFGHRKDVYKKL